MFRKKNKAKIFWASVYVTSTFLVVQTKPDVAARRDNRKGILFKKFLSSLNFHFFPLLRFKRPQYLRNVILYPLYTTAPLVKSPIAYQHTISLSFLLSRDISSPQKLNLLILEHYSDLILSYSSYLKPIALVREEELTLGESTKMEGRQVRAAHLSRLRCNFKPSNQYSSASSGYTYT